MDIPNIKMHNKYLEVCLDKYYFKQQYLIFDRFKPLPTYNNITILC